MRRCWSTLWLMRHDLLLQQQRDPFGDATGVLEWTCQRCGRLVGTTTLTPRWSLVAKLRRSAGRLRAERRRIG